MCQPSLSLKDKTEETNDTMGGRICGTVLRCLLRRKSAEGLSGQAWTGRTNQHSPVIVLKSVTV